MIGRFGNHGIDDDEVICKFGEVREEIRDPESAVSAALEGEVIFSEQSDLVEEGFGTFGGLEGFAVEVRELWFEVERIDVAESSAEADMNDSPGFGSKVGRIASICRDGVCVGPGGGFDEERGEGGSCQ